MTCKYCCFHFIYQKLVEVEYAKTPCHLFETFSNDLWDCRLNCVCVCVREREREGNFSLALSIAC
jgi:hypothetical protein